MSKVKVLAVAVSIDGFGAGPQQSLEAPLGLGGEKLHEWMFQTRTFRRMFGEAGGSEGIDDQFVKQSFDNIGAWIIGRNMFGPVRGPWPDESWKGWWGDNPPFHAPVFVLTHYPRESLTMAGNTTFHFVTEGIHDALARAKQRGGDKYVRIGGGMATIRQYLLAGLVDEMHLALSPVLLGRGEALWTGIDLDAAGYECTAHVATEKAVHLLISRRRGR